MKQVKKHVVFSLVAICFLASSCVYYPRLTGIPLIREKGDTRIEGGATFMPPTLQASISHGLTDNIAIQVAGSFNAEDHYTHFAVGHFRNIENRTVMELYGGFAFGHGYAYNGAKPGSLSGNFQQYFLQFNIGNIERRRANFEPGAGLRLGYMTTQMTDNNFFSLLQQHDPLPVFNLNGIFVEPTVFMRFGGQNLKFHTALGGAKWIQLTHKDKRLPWWGLNFGIGFSYSFGGESRRNTIGSTNF